MRMRAGIAALAAWTALVGAAEAKTWRIGPGPSAGAHLQAALIAMQPGDKLRLTRGVYAVTEGLSLDVDDVSIIGAGPDRTILSFTGQTQGAEGLLVTSDRVILEGFAVENAKGDGIKSKGADEIIFRNLRVEWTGGPNAGNGAYGIYPVSSRDVLIEDSYVRGASDAGIYVGQAQNIIVRKNIVEQNVAGIEIENSYNADVYENVARRNTGGVLVFDLPGLPQQGGHSIRVFRNDIVDNNTPNFAPPGNIVANVPSGTGVLVMANRNVHVFDNVIDQHGTVNIMAIAYRDKIEDANYNPLPRDISITDNRLGVSGYKPDKDLAALAVAGVTLPDIVWDGATTYVAAGKPRMEPVLIHIADNRSIESQPVTAFSLGQTVAGGEIGEGVGQPIPAVSPIERPRPVRLRHAR
jgi:parallel beta-helix repeat protein